MFIVAIFLIAKNWKPPSPSAEDWIRKLWLVHQISNKKG